MIKFENTEVVGWEHAIRGMRNPLNSWEKSDSRFVRNFDDEGQYEFAVGQNDIDLMHRLRNAGSDHRKYLRMITVYVDITAPLYWWKEFDTYKVGTVANSCSTMHKIHAKEFTLEDFSLEHLISSNAALIEKVIIRLNFAREKFIETKNKNWWWQMIQILPSSYNQKRTVMLNYEVIRNMYHARKNHKLDEWFEDFTEWVKSLPYSELITD